MDPSSIKSYNEIMDFAIEKEQEAADLYHDLSKKSEQPGIGGMFLELAKQEEGHKAKLQSLSRDGFPDKGSAEIPDLKIGDYLVDVEIGPDSTYQDVLIFAMKREDAAVALYQRLSGLSPDDATKGLFLTLADEEKKHKLKLETEYDENVLKEN
ncbi:MAG: ferritin-like domain-containing protein [Planctomycetota bacterium]|jgi:rubrerythrin